MIKPGDTVLCIQSQEGGITKKGQEYYVFDTSKCPCCNNLILDVGAKIDMPVSRIFCGLCDNQKGLAFQGDVFWQNSKRFVKRKKHKFSNSITKQLSKETVVKETVERELETI